MKKRLLVFLMLAVLLLLPVMEASAASVRYIVSPNGKKVNLRHGPSQKGYAIACQVSAGTEVKLLSSKKGWSRIVYNGSTVYVMSKYLSATKPGPDGKVSSAKNKFASFGAKVYTPDGRTANMRVSPDLKSDIIFQLPCWTNLTVIGQSGRWYKVEYGVAKGYILKKYIR